MKPKVERGTIKLMLTVGGSDSGLAAVVAPKGLKLPEVKKAITNVCSKFANGTPVIIIINWMKGGIIASITARRGPLVEMFKNLSPEFNNLIKQTKEKIIEVTPEQIKLKEITEIYLKDEGTNSTDGVSIKKSIISSLKSMKIVVKGEK